MNFFEHQDRAKSNSKKIVLFYTIALILMITLIGVVPAIIVSQTGGDGIAVFFGVSGIILLIAGVGTMVKFAWLTTVVLTLQNHWVDDLSVPPLATRKRGC